MAVDRLATLDPRSHIVVFAGIPIMGFAPGTYINVVKDSDAFNLITGVDGESVRTKTNNNAGYVEVTLLQTALVNDLLSAMHQVDLNTPNGDGIGPLLVKDNDGTSLYTAELSWIVKMPDAPEADTPQNRVWKIQTNYLIMHVGGNL